MSRKKSRSTHHSRNRCIFQFTDGRRCRMLCHHTTGALCLFHHRELLQLQSAAEIGAELLDLGGNFQNPIAINFVLGKLFAHVATGRMHRRNASTLAYIAQLLLQTLDQKRYDLARDQYLYRGWTQAVDTLYGRPTAKHSASASASQDLADAVPPPTPLAASSDSFVGAGLQTGLDAPPPTAPPAPPAEPFVGAGLQTGLDATPSTSSNPQTPDSIRAQYPPPANPEFPDALPDTKWLRELVLARRKADAQKKANSPPRL
jgi:hypothetical protein